MKSRPRVLVLASDALVAGFFPPDICKRLEAIATWERFAEREDSQEFRERLSRADALVTTWQSPYLRTQIIRKSPVKAIVHCGGELRARMEDEVLDHVMVANTPEPMARPVAEMAVALMLAFVRRLGEYDRAMFAGAIPRQDDAREGETLAGRRIGVVGFGRIGRALATMLAPFGATLVAADPFVDASDAKRAGVELVELDELLRSCSIVVLTAALTRETKGMIDRRRLALLPKDAVLINVARGALLDLAALVVELESGRISAALDVTDPLEPLPADHRLRRAPNVILTPHVAGGGVETRRAMGEAAVAELERIFRGEKPQSLVTRAMLERMT
ncbi:MAG: hydroxyacid dehydrogenase [Candidatus Binatia bacterium]